MSDAPRPTLSTRWTLLDRLHGTASEEAWRWFIERYRPFVRSCLRRMVREPGRAAAAEEDIWSYLFTSEVFEKADRGRRFRSYLAGTVRHFVQSWLRGDRTPHAEQDDVPEPEAAVALPEDVEARLWARHVLHLALAALADRHPDDARVLRLFYGLDDSEDGIEFGEPQAASAVARELGIKPNGVHQILHRGRKRLRALIEAEVTETVRDTGQLAEEIELMVQAMSEVPGLAG